MMKLSFVPACPDRDTARNVVQPLRRFRLRHKKSACFARDHTNDETSAHLRTQERCEVDFFCDL